jgi:DNA helicase-2/ATP-dependent DNA helicase PcrA
LNRFILAPYGKVFKFLPGDYFLIEDIDFDFLNNRSFKDTTERLITEKLIEKQLFSRGVVTYTQVEIRAHELLATNKDTIRKEIGNRIQFLFVDEFQDASSTQYEIFEQLRIEGKTQIYYIGDPEQYIYGFTYHDKHRKAVAFSDIPIKKVEKVAKVIKKPISAEGEENKRSTSKIVDFLNNFRDTNHKQKPVVKYLDEADVYFVNDVDMEVIVKKFDELCKKKIPMNIQENKEFSKFFLSRNNETFTPISLKLKMQKISNEFTTPRSILSEALDYVCAVSGKSKSEILKECRYTMHDLRKKGVLLLTKVMSDRDITDSDLRQYIQKEIPIKFKEENQKTQDLFKRIVASFQIGAKSTNKNSSIHKSKGLEASAVLALAENKSRLLKWLETDYAKREKDKQDESRIGFVAFSRARDFLCIACLEKVDNLAIGKMKVLGVQIV